MIISIEVMLTHIVVEKIMIYVVKLINNSKRLYSKLILNKNNT
jgi:hypothetical protein